jgi:predicted nucleotidyltransferase
LKKPKEEGTLEEMTPVTDALLEEITRAIVETAKPRKVVLFGSRARGNAHPESDIDILVIEDEPFGPQRSRRKEMARLWHALSRFDMAKDILVYAREEVEKWEKSRNHVVVHALRTGRTLYERN